MKTDITIKDSIKHITDNAIYYVLFAIIAYVSFSEVIKKQGTSLLLPFIFTLLHAGIKKYKTDDWGSLVFPFAIYCIVAVATFQTASIFGVAKTSGLIYVLAFIFFHFFYSILTGAIESSEDSSEDSSEEIVQ